MKHGWIVFLFTACVVRIGSPFHLPPPDPEAGPAASGSPPPPGPPGIPDAERRSAAEERTRQVAQSYDLLLDQMARADRDASAHQEEAEGRYRQAVEVADQLLDDLVDARAPAAVYPTRSDGPIDHATLIAKLRDLRARAERLGKAAHARSIAALEAELHARTAEQRAVVADHGRPDEVRRQKRQACWIYRDTDTEETFCWTAAGRLARHNRASTAIASRPAPEGKPTEPAPERPKRLPVQAYYAAATFAAGECSFSDCFKSGWTTRLPDGESASTSCSFGDCSKSGWTTRLPGGESASTSCSFGDCFKSGWTTRLPDGESASTSCSFGDCSKSGWTTRLPNGESASTSCSFSDCFKSGWSTRLPDGGSISCSCNFSDCAQHGASCH